MVELDTHTEHCCKRCGCKYGYHRDPQAVLPLSGTSWNPNRCTVVNREKPQSFPCGSAYCWDTDMNYHYTVVYITGGKITIEQWRGGPLLDEIEDKNSILSQVQWLEDIINFDSEEHTGFILSGEKGLLPENKLVGLDGW